MARGACVLTVLLALAVAAPEAHAAAVFRVGASVQTINPDYPVYMGGYGGGPAGGTIARHVDPLTGRPEDLTVRAISIQSGGSVVEIAAVDTQGYFAGYQEGPYGITDARDAAAAYMRAHGAPDVTRANVVVAALHEHAAPTLLGLWGPPPHQERYLEEVYAATVAALEQAYASARPATITWGKADDPYVADLTIAEGNAFEGWPRDGSLGTLWARDAQTGETIATFVTQPGYPNIVYGPGDLLGKDGQPAGAVLSTDFPHYLEDFLQQRLGGVAVVTDGTLGNQTSPMQTDITPSPDLPDVKGMRQTRAFDDAIRLADRIGVDTLGALGSGVEIATPSVLAADSYIQTPVTNPALAALAEVAPAGGGVFWHDAGLDNAIYPTDRAFSPPYGTGELLGTWVTSVRVGDLDFLTMPGEFFPSEHETWDRSIHGADGVFVIGAAQDFLGYDYPAYAYPFTFEGSDEGIFNPSLTLGDQVVAAGQQEARALGFDADTTTSAELTALENNYARAVRPGVQLMAFPAAGDIDPKTGAYSATFEGFSQGPRISESAPCGPINPSTAAGCPLPPAPMSDFRWRFGDGTVAVTKPAGYARAYLSPYVHHDYTRPGVYPVQVAATDEHGTEDTMTLPLTVHPALRASIVRSGTRLVARVRGGSGDVLIERWHAGGEVFYAHSIPVRRRACLRVVDSTGTAVHVCRT